ncbi:MAG: ATP-binding cassette domain-containing protein [Lachnospiraceae bacterium]|nr:ATP-binding cassette domain-containing protein [Lachnospiraceae bacterium]
MTDSVLEVRHVSSYYRKARRFSGTHPGLGEQDTQVLRDVTFSIRRGETMGLVGESGSGKTTLCRAILGLGTDYEGEIIHHTDHPQMVFQDPYSSLNPARTVGWTLREALRAGEKRGRRESQVSVPEMLRQAGLSEEYIDRYPYELSGGQRQRVCIAAAVIQRPQLILLDEPVSALDVTVQAQILKLLVRLKKEFGLSYLFISHDLNVIYQICDRVLVMKQGKIVESGDVRQVYENPQHDYTRMLLAAAD